VKVVIERLGRYWVVKVNGQALMTFASLEDAIHFIQEPL
jgi:hypothetical protein